MTVGSLYALLGVGPDASAADIKRAYFRGVKEHSPEQDPETFKLIRSAYETLSDPEARRDYDTLQQYGGEIQALSEEADSFAEAEDWGEAIRRYKRILVLDPHSGAARNALGLCHMQSADFAAAVSAYTTLVQQHPDSVAYRMNLGWAHFGASRQRPTHDVIWRDELKAAQDAFYEAVLLETLNSDAHQAVSDVRREFGDWEGAAAWLESAISADGETDLHDVDALCQLCEVHVAAGKPEELKCTLQRFAGVASDLREAKDYVSARMGALGAQMTQAGQYAEANIVFEHAIALAPHDLRLLELRDLSNRIQKVWADFERMQADPHVIAPIKVLAWGTIAPLRGEEVSESDRAEAIQTLTRYVGSTIAASVNRLRRNYPALYLFSRELYEAIDGLGR